MVGWVRIDRQIQEHWLWEEKPFSKGQAWIDLILLANHEANKLAYKGGIINTRRGTVYRSISWLAKRWGWSRDKARNFLVTLEADGMATIKATTNQTTITLANYGKYQDLPTTYKTSSQTANRQRTSQRADTYNNVNNDNNENKYNTAPAARAPEAPGAVAEADRIRRLAE